MGNKKSDGAATGQPHRADIEKQGGRESSHQGAVVPTKGETHTSRLIPVLPEIFGLNFSTSVTETRAHLETLYKGNKIKFWIIAGNPWKTC